MSQTDEMVAMLKDWLTAANPGLVTRQDLLQVEERLDELATVVDELETLVEKLLAGRDASAG